MFEEPLDAEHVFGHHVGMSRTPVRRRRAVILLVAVSATAVLTGPVASALARHGGRSPAAERTYVVQPGDTVWSIAARNDGGRDPRLEVDAIIRRNGLQDARILPGQALVVPLAA